MHKRSYRRWQRLWQSLTGKHTHHHILNSTDSANWSYIEQLEIVAPFTKTDYNQVMQHPSSGVYWAMYAEDKYREYEPLPEADAMQIVSRPELLVSRRNAFSRT